MQDHHKCCDCQASYIGETGSKQANTNGRQGMVTSTITLLSTVYRRNVELTGTLRQYNVFYRLLSTSYLRKLVY